MHKTLLVVVLGIAMAQASQVPYAVPTFASLSSNTWPSYSEWASLNGSVGGHLQALRPWAAVCYSSDPLYNLEQCQSVLSGYRNDTQACFNMYCVLRTPDIDYNHRSVKQLRRRFCGRTGSRVITTKVAL